MSSPGVLHRCLLPYFKLRPSPWAKRLLRVPAKGPKFPNQPLGSRGLVALPSVGGRRYSTEAEVSPDLGGAPSHPVPPTDDGKPRIRTSNDRRLLLASAAHMRRVQHNCSGCGAVLQSEYPKRRGYIHHSKLEEWLALSEDPMKALGGTPEELDQLNQQVVRGVKGESEKCVDNVEDYFPDSMKEDEAEKKKNFTSFVCSRCFSLQHYNDALNITLDSQDYLRHLSSLKSKKSLLILMLDVVDFPSCVFPNLNSLISTDSSVLIVANKIDLFPRNLTNSFWSKLRDQIVAECKERSLGDNKIVGVRFISVKCGIGTTELAQEIVRKWKGQGDIYLLGCTNVGKSSLFNNLLFHLCGSRPGELNTDSNLLAPQATISQWPGTTLGLLSFPLISLGKRRRLLEQQRKREEQIAQGVLKFEDFDDEHDDFKTAVRRFEDDNPGDVPELRGMSHLSEVEVENVLDELGLRRRRKKKPIAPTEAAPQNKCWLHDTPGAINEAQLINYLTPKELTLGLPKAPIKPKTFILKPGQSLFLGGLARLDYLEGAMSTYFTVFAWSYLKLHATKSENADQLYERHLGKAESIFKLPLNFEEREEGAPPFPPLAAQDLSITGTGWKESAADVVLSSAGWVSVTVGKGEEVLLRAHTPKGKGVYVRQPSLFDEAVNDRGTRERYGNRTAYLGNNKKRPSRT